MRIFVGEFNCGGGLAGKDLDKVPSSLRTEGSAMLRAIVADLSDFAKVTVPLDTRIDLDLDRADIIAMRPDVALFGQWVAAARDCDAAIIVAPENDGILAKSVAMLRAAGVDVIAGSGDFLRVASDKLQTAKLLLSCGVAHPYYVALSDTRYEAELQGYARYVLKPRDGCGTHEIRTFNSYDEARAELSDELLLQPWLPGRAVSVSLVASGQHQVFLPAVSQEICAESCEYAGGRGPLDDDAQSRAAVLASRAIAAMPPTARGFVGVDLLLGDCASEDYVIEINPRLTTSYVGLRQIIQGNLAARLFDLETGPVSCITGVNAVRWRSDGRVWINDAAVAEPI
ncbi:ATP-grasp domain-containing protein [Novipirellula artificiosorum]|uniref:Carbamoyl phosphate synthase-like protein n=1 Tax=Novipirellula artificiosorum TaxID=2528016 RepID=A0A5C6DNB4_9BACT|nr:ATP-grasp domain-containing protein [Novipirellula artificiosorum]TWU37357.1 carbamoyl phosphate synthase-like protein [Novipirellula artificiosorum]